MIFNFCNLKKSSNGLYTIKYNPWHLVTKSDLCCKILSINDEHDSNSDDEYDYIYNIKLLMNRDQKELLNLYPYTCCSESKDKLYILGREVHTYYRNVIRCSSDECKNYSCDTCLGHTNNGYYDIVKIFNDPTKVNVRNICLSCFADNRTDLQGISETLPIVNGRFEHTNNHKLLRCSTCNREGSLYRSPQDNLEFSESFLLKNIRKLLKNENASLDLYYMVDDCLSCS